MTTRPEDRDRPQLSLRPVTDDDIAVFFEHQQDPTACHMAAFTGEDPSDRSAHDAHWAKIRGIESIVIRTITAEEEVMGHVASFLREGDREVTYWIGRPHWGRGVATTALAQFLEIDDTRPLYARAAKDNLASIRVLEKCGFKVCEETKGFANARGAEIDELVLRLAP